jgi:hypothetical protein
LQRGLQGQNSNRSSGWNQNGWRPNYGGNFRQNNYQYRYDGGFNASNAGGYNRYATGGRATGGSVDDALLQKTVAAVVAAVTAAQKPSETVAPAGSVQPGAAAEATSLAGASGMASEGPMAAASGPGTEKIAAVVAPKGNEVTAPAKKKKLDKNACFRCKNPGHLLDDCTVPFCVYCESIHHVSAACHLLHAQKPTVTLHGYANEQLMFFELPCSGSYKPKMENPKLAKVTVEGEALSIPEIIEHLKRIVPFDNFNWEVYHYRDNVFRVKFPNRNEIQRLKNFGMFQCPDKGSDLTFDFWSSLEEPLYMLPEVWMQVSGIPSDIRSDFLTLWGIGSLFGMTSEVDMEFTRKNHILRIKLGCVDSTLIPPSFDVFIRRGFFKLFFKVESSGVKQVVNLFDNTDAKKDDDGGFEDNMDEENDRNADMELDPTDKGVDNENVKGDLVYGKGNPKNSDNGLGAQPMMVLRFGTFDTKIPLTGNSIVSGKKQVVYVDAVESDYVQPCDNSNVNITAGVESVITYKRRVPSPHAARPSSASAPESGPISHAARTPSAAASELLLGAAMSPASPAVGVPLAAMGSDAAIISSTAGMVLGAVSGPRMGVSRMMDGGLCEGLEPMGGAGASADVGPLASSSPSHGGSAASPMSSVPPELPVEVDDGGLVEQQQISSVNACSGKHSNGSFELSDQSCSAEPCVNVVSLDDVIAFGGIPCAEESRMRSSTRIASQPNADMTQLEKAMLNSKLRNSLGSGMSQSPKYSILSISDDEILDKATRLGVSLGSSIQVAKNSIQCLKDKESERLLTILQKKSTSMDEGPSSLVVTRVSNLCEDLIDDEDNTLGSEEVLDSHITEVKEQKKRQRKIYDMTKVRRSTRKRTKKHFS